MKSRILLKRILLIITVIGLSVFLWIIFHFVFQDEVESNLAQLTAKVTAFYEQKETDLVGFPTHLKIPTINVNAFVEYVGLTSKGAIDVPTGSANVAWFDLGPRPGEVGSAVIDGHFGYKNNKKAVFDDLYKLKKGDLIYVEDRSGVITTFMVRELKSYGKDEDTSAVFNSGDTEAHLNLITCTGDWNKEEKTHSKRLVVFTDLVPILR